MSDSIGRRDPHEGTIALARAALEKLDDEGQIEICLRLGATKVTLPLRAPARSVLAEEFLAAVVERFEVTLKALDMAAEALCELDDRGTAAQCVAVSKRGHDTLARYREEVG